MIIPKRSLLVPSRRAFLAGAGGLAGDLLLPPHLVKACQTIAAASTAYPGQSGNPVGYAAAPGYPGSLTAWPGGNFTANTTYSYYLFDTGSSGAVTNINAANVTFNGCYFGCSNGASYSTSPVTMGGSGSHPTFNYCTFGPS